MRFAFLFLIFLVTSSVHAKSDGPSLAEIQKKLTIDSLKNRPGIAVMISANKQFYENIMSEEKLTTIVQKKLRESGIKVIDDTKDFTPSKDIFLVAIPTSVTDKNEVLYAISFTLQASQLVNVVRTKTSMLIAPTWITNSAIIVGKDHFSDLKSFFEDDVDEFINAYLKANPKKT